MGLCFKSLTPRQGLTWNVRPRSGLAPVFQRAACVVWGDARFTMRGSRDHLTLRQGCRIGVVGGGPAGSFFSYFLQEMARDTDVDVHLDIYERVTSPRQDPPAVICAAALCPSPSCKLWLRKVLTLALRSFSAPLTPTLFTRMWRCAHQSLPWDKCLWSRSRDPLDNAVEGLRLQMKDFNTSSRR